jgi:PAS domain S-box-containing protein
VAQWESMLDGFAVCLAVRGEDGCIVDFCYECVNDAACWLNGLEREQMLGRGIGELFPAYLDGELFQAQRRVLETGEPWRREEIVYERAWHARRSAVRALRAAWSRSGTVSPSVGAR